MSMSPKNEFFSRGNQTEKKTFRAIVHEKWIKVLIKKNLVNGK